VIPRSRDTRSRDQTIGIVLTVVVLAVAVLYAAATPRGAVLYNTNMHVFAGTQVARGSDIDVLFPRNATARIVMSFRVTDCSASQYGPVPVSVHLNRWIFVHTETLVDHGVDFSDAGVACGRYH
jgi:hypothetical protein